jgi:membrane protease YdiL (CAAX protease family)
MRGCGRPINAAGHDDKRNRHRSQLAAPMNARFAQVAAGTSARRAITHQLVVFPALLLLTAVVAAMVIRLWAPAETPAFIIWTSTPLVAVLAMHFGVSRQRVTHEAWRSLGLRRLGTRLWWIALVVTLTSSILATAAVTATGLASFTVPAEASDTVINFVVNVVIMTCTFALAEEVVFRGYLLPRLLFLGRNRALAACALVHAVWHVPLIVLTPIYHADGNPLIVLPLFVATIVAAGFYFGDLRLATDSVWPAAIAHAVHNAAWGALAGFTVLTAPVVVEEYLAGDNGVFVLLFTVAAAAFLRVWVNRRPRLPHIPSRTVTARVDQPSPSHLSR